MSLRDEIDLEPNRNFEIGEVVAIHDGGMRADVQVPGRVDARTGEPAPWGLLPVEGGLAKVGQTAIVGVVEGDRFGAAITLATNVRGVGGRGSQPVEALQSGMWTAHRAGPGRLNSTGTPAAAPKGKLDESWQTPPLPSGQTGLSLLSWRAGGQGYLGLLATSSGQGHVYVYLQADGSQVWSDSWDLDSGFGPHWICNPDRGELLAYYRNGEGTYLMRAWDASTGASALTGQPGGPYVNPSQPPNAGGWPAGVKGPLMLGDWLGHQWQTNGTIGNINHGSFGDAITLARSSAPSPPDAGAGAHSTRRTGLAYPNEWSLQQSTPSFHNFGSSPWKETHFWGSHAGSSVGDKRIVVYAVAAEWLSSEPFGGTLFDTMFAVLVAVDLVESTILWTQTFQDEIEGPYYSIALPGVGCGAQPSSPASVLYTVAPPTWCAIEEGRLYHSVAISVGGPGGPIHGKDAEGNCATAWDSTLRYEVHCRDLLTGALQAKVDLGTSYGGAGGGGGSLRLDRMLTVTRDRILVDTRLDHVNAGGVVGLDRSSLAPVWSLPHTDALQVVCAGSDWWVDTSRQLRKASDGTVVGAYPSSLAVSEGLTIPGADRGGLRSLLYAYDSVARNVRRVV